MLTRDALGPVLIGPGTIDHSSRPCRGRRHGFQDRTRRPRQCSCRNGLVQIRDDGGTSERSAAARSPPAIAGTQLSGASVGVDGGERRLPGAECAQRRVIGGPCYRHAGEVQTVPGSRIIVYKSSDGSTEPVYGITGEKAAVAAMASCGVGGDHGVVIFFKTSGGPASSSGWYSPTCRGVGGGNSGGEPSTAEYPPGKGFVDRVWTYKTGVIVIHLLQSRLP
jgi:hypothetical protein